MPTPTTPVFLTPLPAAPPKKRPYAVPPLVKATTDIVAIAPPKTPKLSTHSQTKILNQCYLLRANLMRARKKVKELTSENQFFTEENTLLTEQHKKLAIEYQTALMKIKELVETNQLQIQDINVLHHALTHASQELIKLTAEKDKLMQKISDQNAVIACDRFLSSRRT